MAEMYENAVCLAPMVRAGTLPLRLLSLRYGADLVYGEEIIAKRIIATKRVYNPVVDTIDYLSQNGESVVFRTCAEEKEKVVFQIGTSDAVLALHAAEKVAQDVASIDINMGCPKHFSIQGGMGAALLKKPELACDIVKTLQRNLNLPVSCKIRILEDSKMTIDFAKSLEQAGAMAIGIHARHVHERPMDDAHWEALTPVVDALNIPVLANGDVFVREDIEKARKITGANSFLIARGALMNASIFREEGMLPPSQVVVDYLKVVAETDNVFQNSKYNVARMIPTKISTCTEETSKVTVAELGETKNNLQMFQLWNLQDFYHTKQRVFETRAKEFNVTKEGYQKLVPLHRYDDQHILNRDLYCDLCGIQLLGEKDIALHLNGRKHRNKMKQSLITQNNSTEIENIEPKEDGNSRTKIPVSKKLKTTSSL